MATCDGCGTPQGTVREFAANGSLACPNEACNYTLCNACAASTQKRGSELKQVLHEAHPREQQEKFKKREEEEAVAKEKVEEKATKKGAMVPPQPETRHTTV